MAYATVDDLSKRWRPIKPDEVERATTLLEDASMLIDSEMAYAGKAINPEDEYQLSVARIVCCSIVKRVLASSFDGDYTQISKTAGSFSEQFTFANPSGDMYLTAREYRMLGIPQHQSNITQLPPKLKGDCNEG